MLYFTLYVGWAGLDSNQGYQGDAAAQVEKHALSYALFCHVVCSIFGDNHCELVCSAGVVSWKEGGAFQTVCNGS